MNVKLWTDREAWDAYVESRPDASNYHRWRWREPIERTFGHRAYYLAAESSGRLVGVLPLILVRSRLFADALVSMPFYNYGGVLASTSEARQQLLFHAAALAGELKVKHVELRHSEAFPIDWVESTRKVTVEMALPTAVEDLWKELSAGRRKKLRNARNKEIRVEWGGLELADDFYRVFARNMRDLGSPVHQQGWFENLFRCSPAETRFVVLRDRSLPVAAAMVTSFRDTLELPCAASLRESQSKYMAILLYWSVIEWAIANGFKKFDMGRCTPGGGTWEFKRHWSKQEKPLHWYYWLADGVPVPALRPENPKFRLAIRIWRTLPVSLTTAVGPVIARSIP